MEKIETNIDDKLIKEAYRPLYRLSIIAIAIALAFVVFYVVFSILNKNWFDALNLVALSVSFVLVICAIYLLIRIHQMIKKEQAFSRKAIYELFDEYVTYEVYRNNEKIESGKAYYRDLQGYRESKNTVFLIMRNNSYIAIKKVDGLVDFIKSRGLVKKKR